jgi:DNA-directed RNA polymerase specialized sigma24 family protein
MVAIPRPSTVSIDPSFLEDGAIGAQTAQTDTYFPNNVEPTLRIVVGHFMEQLPEPQKSAVEMCIMKNMSYREAAEWFSIERNFETHKKTVWRWAQSGIKMLRSMLEEASWGAAIEPRILPKQDIA